LIVVLFLLPFLLDHAAWVILPQFALYGPTDFEAEIDLQEIGVVFHK